VKLNVPLFGLLLFLSSCDPFALKPLGVHTVTTGSRTVRWFYTSSITTIHNHVEIKTAKGWEQLMETDGNAYKIYDVSIDKDTVIVKTRPGTLLYQLESYYWGTYVRLDSSIPEVEYNSKFFPTDKKVR
jgi:hypothetical protein